jgi:hypothetical protein
MSRPENVPLSGCGTKIEYDPESDHFLFDGQELLRPAAVKSFKDRLTLSLFSGTLCATELWGRRHCSFSFSGADRIDRIFLYFYFIEDSLKAVRRDKC